jgi:aspartate kinase
MFVILSKRIQIIGTEVNWDLTQKNISKHKKNFKRNPRVLGSNENNFTTTLGREGSDYTAAIFAYCLNAESVTIWKDVPGVMNADQGILKILVY